jgi:hypothetical protein
MVNDLKKLAVANLRLYTAEEAKRMDINELIEKLEEKLGRSLDPGTLLRITMAKGAGSVHAIDLNKGEVVDERVSWEKVATILNGPSTPPMPQYLGPLVEISDVKHFADAFLFALEHSLLEVDRDPKTRQMKRKETPVASLIDGFQHLMQVAKNYEKNGWHFKVHPDFVKHSFVFSCFDAEEKFVYNGGLILSKEWNKDRDKYEDNANMRWSIHT